MTSNPPRKRGAPQRPARSWRERVDQPVKRRQKRHYRSQITVERPQPKVNPVSTAPWPLRWQSSRLAALLLCGITLLALGQFLLNDAFYVYAMDVQGIDLLDEGEVFEQSGVAGYNILWIRPEQVEQALLSQPYVRSVRVSMGLLNRVHIHIVERVPRLAWVVADDPFWVDEEGVVLSPRGEPRLLPALEDPEGALMVAEGRLNRVAVTAALEMHEMLPTVEAFQYSPSLGLHFRLPGGTQVYLGGDEDMVDKVALLKAMRDDLATKETQPELIDLRFESGAYYR